MALGVRPEFLGVREVYPLGKTSRHNIVHVFRYHVWRRGETRSEYLQSVGVGLAKRKKKDVLGKVLLVNVLYAWLLRDVGAMPKGSSVMADPACCLLTLLTLLTEEAHRGGSPWFTLINIQRIQQICRSQRFPSFCLPSFVS